MPYRIIAEKEKNEDKLTEVERLRAELKLERAKRKQAEMEISFLKKIGRNREEAGLSRLKKLHIYLAIQEEHEEHGYSISALCKLGRVTRAAITNGFIDKFL